VKIMSKARHPIQERAFRVLFQAGMLHFYRKHENENKNFMSYYYRDLHLSTV
jgi:Zn-dependent peptidase ImmA (M78 family)